MGTGEVGALTASGTSSEEISLTAPTGAGTYYYGACVDAVSGESATGNNCSSGVQVTVTVEGEGPAPDLVVLGLNVSDSTLETGETFGLFPTVHNQGNGSSSATTLRYYRSTDRSISSSDTQVGTGEVGALTASGTNSEEIEISLTAPTDAGTYYYGVCVDAVSGESATGNNCSSGVQVTVTVEGEGPAPDLIVLGPNVSDSTPETGGTFRLIVTVHNQGDAQSATTTVRYFRSTDATITTSDMLEGTDVVGEKGPLQNYAATIRLTAPATAGTYYYGACVDAVSGESATGNNCSSGVQVTVTVEGEGPAPDLVVLGLNVSDSTLETGETFGLFPTVHNQGNGSSSATTLRYYRSTDRSISSSDTQVGTGEVGALTASGTNSEEIEISLTAPTDAGTYYYGVCVDAVSGESATGNNCSSGVQVTVTVEGEGPAPDLIVLGPNVSDSTPETGGTFRLIVTVHNQGDAQSATTTVRYFRSTDATITTSDMLEGTDVVGEKGPLQNYAATIRLTAPATAGTYYYGACVDAVSEESATGNNCSSGVQVTVSAPPPPPGN